MNADVLSCDYCGRPVRVYSTQLLHYRIRWFDKRQICICSDCKKNFPKEKESDKPSRMRRRK